MRSTTGRGRCGCDPTDRCRLAVCSWVTSSPEVSEHLVGSAAFKAVGTGDPRPAGSIPVHLRQSIPGHGVCLATRRTPWSRIRGRVGAVYDDEHVSRQRCNQPQSRPLDVRDVSRGENRRRLGRRYAWSAGVEPVAGCATGDRRAGPGRVVDPRLDLRGVSDGSPRRDGRPSGAPTRCDSRSRDRGHRRASGPALQPIRGGRQGGRALAAVDVRALPLLHERSGEPVRRATIHRVGRRRWLRRVHRCARGVRVLDPGPVRRCQRCTTAVRRHHRIPGTAARPGPRRREPRHLRVRRFSAPHRPTRTPPTATECTS